MAEHCLNGKAKPTSGCPATSPSYAMFKRNFARVRSAGHCTAGDYRDCAAVL